MTEAGRPKPNGGDVLYVYDRICTKQSKKYELSREYLRVSGTNPNRVYGRAFAQSQRQRASLSEQQKRVRWEADERLRAEGAGEPEAEYASDSSEKYGSVGYDGAAAMKHPFRTFLEHAVGWVDSLLDRDLLETARQKRQAAIRKKIEKTTRILLTVLIFLAVALGFCGLTYKLFFVISDIDTTGSTVYSAAELAEAAGVEVGDNLYSFSSGKAEEQITFLCPYIRSVRVERTVPHDVKLVVEEDTAMFYAEIWGDTVKLSEGLRVLERTDENEAREEGLIQLILPPVTYSVAGRVLQFAETKNDRFIRRVLTDAASSSLGSLGMLDSIDLSDEYEITMRAEGAYLLRFGDEEDCDLKLRMAYKTLTDATFNLPMASLDLREVGVAVVRPESVQSLD